MTPKLQTIKVYLRPPSNFCYVQTWLFQFVGNDTTDEVRLGGSQSGHQVVQLFLKYRESLLCYELPLHFQLVH